MRISLLREREPFPDILEKTLSQFWSRHFGQEITVRWQDGRVPSHAQGQTWLVNAYLNAIFLPDAQATVFDPIRREFSRSPVWWKLPLQAAYVQAASSRLTASWLAQAHLRVSPPVPQAQEQLVIAGNHKIRWLDVREGKVYGLRKAGFHEQFMRQEITARQQAAVCGLPVPPLLAADEETYGWFCEQLVSGTPINRLADKQQAAAAVQQVYTALTNLYAQTATQLPTCEYAAMLQQRILALVDAHHLLGEGEKTAVRQQTAQLTKHLSSMAAPVTLALTHGDFQPANILLNEAGTWLIDWEYAAQRQIGYDVLVYSCAARFPTRLAQRLQQFINNDFSHSLPVMGLWPTETARHLSAHLFMLEESLFHLTQTYQPLFTTPGAGWADWQQAIAQWLAMPWEQIVD
ncbi:MAG: phosphotransferase [Ardenticatenaceae bacterium]|nr:phosphotransferase [Ardenticatenaceae bacterium]MCB9005498.1 phosphotransferase [Ardenticatenaceae bacterium]